MFDKKFETFCIIEIWTLLRGASSARHAVFDFQVFIFFGHIVMFCQCGVESLEVLENWSARRMGNFTREFTLNDDDLGQFWSACKVHWMTLEQLVEIFIKLSIFDSSRAICVLLWGQNQLLVPTDRISFDCWKQ